jgi:hypothetical protein
MSIHQRGSSLSTNEYKNGINIITKTVNNKNIKIANLNGSPNTSNAKDMTNGILVIKLIFCFDFIVGYIFVPHLGHFISCLNLNEARNMLLQLNLWLHLQHFGNFIEINSFFVLYYHKIYISSMADNNNLLENNQQQRRAMTTPDKRIPLF